MQTVLGIILGGGAGTRLYPLTKKRAKPAVPLGANYRLIDIPVSNCVNSNVTKIYCLTQFNSASLNRHLSQAYVSDSAERGQGVSSAGDALLWQQRYQCSRLGWWSVAWFLMWVHVDSGGHQPAVAPRCGHTTSSWPAPCSTPQYATQSSHWHYLSCVVSAWCCRCCCSNLCAFLSAEQQCWCVHQQGFC